MVCCCQHLFDYVVKTQQLSIPPPPSNQKGSYMNPAATEIVQIVDRDNSAIDCVERQLMRKDKLIHRAAYIFVFNSKQEIFCQKRSMTKDVYPGFWDLAAGGVVLCDESYEESANRELAEELGISGVEIFPEFNNYFEGDSNKVWGRIFTCQHEGPFNLQEEEIDHGRFMGIEEILALSKTEGFTPDGIQILHRLLFNREECCFFLHGLESSSKGTKAKFFKNNFEEIVSPDFKGDLGQRLNQLTTKLAFKDKVTLIGSSFGGLMATCYVQKHPEQIKKIILLAPALNFADFSPPEIPISIPVTLFIGKNDDVCPPEKVLPLAEKSFHNLQIHLLEDDHMLHKNYKKINWANIIFQPL